MVSTHLLPNLLMCVCAFVFRSLCSALLRFTLTSDDTFDDDQ